MIKQALFLLALAATCTAKAQNNVGIGTPTPNASAVLDITSSSKGVLLPRVALTAANAASPLGAFVAGMVVYNTATAGAAPNDVSPGFYYCDGTAWLKLVTNASGWNISGNAGTSSASHFIGTTDNQDLIFKRNNLRAGLLSLNNTSWGTRALNPATTGNANTANGYQSLFTNTGGNNNTANGSFALYSNNTGSNNVGTGMQSLYYNQAGSNNAATGYNALQFNVSGSNNTASGTQSLLNNNSGDNNTAIGIGAMQSNISGSSNVAMGINALYLNTNKNNLVAIGDSALYQNGSAAVGAAEAIQNTGVGSKVLYNTILGSGNTAMGFQALFNNANGNNNTAAGFKADVITANLSNATAIGANAKAGLSNSLILGDSTNNVKVGIGTGYPTTAKLVIKTTPGATGIDLASSDGYAEMRVIRNTLNSGDHDLYFNLLAPSPSSLHMFSNGIETMTIKNTSVGIGTGNPVSTAALEISSTAKGFLPPRMSYAQRDAIASPATGLIIWCNNCGLYGQVQVYNGIEWTNIIGGTRDVSVGETFQGGKVAYILQPADPGYVAGQTHGLIATPTDLGNADWGCRGTSIVGTSTLIGTGNANTNLITGGCATAGIAARLCSNLILSGYSDWYLPSEKELLKLSINQLIIGGFSATNYWSSTQSDLNMGSTIDFNTNGQISADKSLSFPVRAVRSF